MRLALHAGLIGLCAITVACDENTEGGSKGPGGGGVARDPGCGNDVLDGIEPCDGGAFLQGGSCADYGLGTGTVSCTYTCELNIDGCAQTDYCTANSLYGDGACDPCDLLGGIADTDCATACAADTICANSYDTLTGTYVCDNAGLTDPDCGTCGDSALDANELCDATMFPVGADTCETYGFRAGQLGCSDCQPTFNTCEFCGDSKRNGGEQCDASDLGGQSCTGLGFAGGRAACTDTCILDTTGCVRDVVDPTKLANAMCSYLDRCKSVMGTTVDNQTQCAAKYGEAMSCSDPADFPSQAAVTACANALSVAECGSTGLFTALIACELGEIPGEGDPCPSYVCGPDLFCDFQQSDTGLCASCVRSPGLGQACEGQCDEDTWCNDGFCAARVANGSSCFEDDECVSDECVEGTCSAIGTLEVSDPCRSDDDCREFLSCNAGFCANRVAAGQSCDSSDDCFIYAECDDGVCADALACLPAGSVSLNGACNETIECGAALYCDGGPETCQQILSSGTLCDYDEQCGPGSHCSWSDETCMPYSGVGGACGSGEQCVDGAYCDYSQSQCTARAPLGGTCEQFDGCTEGICLDGTCSETPACQ